MHARTQRHMCVHTKKFKATKAIAPGQELFIRYGSASWFQSKGIRRVDVDYASTKWRPDLQPLACRQKVAQTTQADGRHRYAIFEGVPSGTILEISLCLQVAVRVVDQFPFLWDFVLAGETANEYTGCLQPSASSRAQTHRVCFFADPGEGTISNLQKKRKIKGHAEMVSCPFVH